MTNENVEKKLNSKGSPSKFIEAVKKGREHVD